MSNSVLIATGAVEVIRTSQIVDVNGSPLTGLTNIKLAVVRDSDGKLLDFSNNTFASSPSSTYATMTELDAAHFPGVYSYSLNTGAFVGASAGDKYKVYVSQQGGSNAANALQSGELRVSLVDTITSNLDVAVSSRAAPGALMGLASGAIGSGTFGSGAITSSVLAASAVAAIQSGLATSAGVTSATSGLATSAALSTVQAGVTAIPSAVWATAEGGTAGTVLYDLTLARKFITNKMAETAGDPGTVILYDDDAATPLKTWALLDGTGGAVTSSAGEPASRGAAT